MLVIGYRELALKHPARRDKSRGPNHRQAGRPCGKHRRALHQNWWSLTVLRDWILVIRVSHGCVVTTWTTVSQCLSAI